MPVTKINRSIKIEDGKLVVTVAYAEANLSKAALSVAEKTKEGTHYEWVWGENATVVLYELPNVFNVTSFIAIAREMSMYCSEYIKAAKLTDSNILKRFMENKKSE